MSISNIKFQISNNPIGTKGGSSSKPASSMAELMAKASSQKPFISPKKGDMLKGTITRLTPSDISVDIAAKSDAKVLEKDPKILKVLLSTLSVGQEVTVSVLNPESDLGNPVVSLRRFVEDILWKELEAAYISHKKIPAVIRETTRGGFLVETQMGFSGFLPNSQITFPVPAAESQAQELIGKKIEVQILEHQRAAKKIILTQKVMMDASEFQKAVSDLKIGQKLQGVVANVTTFGVFVTPRDKPAIDAILHISEVSWEEVKDLQSLFTQGQEIEAVIIGFDNNAKRIELSLKKLTQDPFEELTKNLKVDQKIECKVEKVDDTGVSVEIVVDSGVVGGLLRKEKIPVGTTYEKGQTIQATVSQIDTKRRKVYVSPVLLRKTVGYR